MSCFHFSSAPRSGPQHPRVRGIPHLGHCQLGDAAVRERGDPELQALLHGEGTGHGTGTEPPLPAGETTPGAAGFLSLCFYLIFPETPCGVLIFSDGLSRLA